MLDSGQTGYATTRNQADGRRTVACRHVGGLNTAAATDVSAKQGCTRRHEGAARRLPDLRAEPAVLGRRRHSGPRPRRTPPRRSRSRGAVAEQHAYRPPTRPPCSPDSQPLTLRRPDGQKCEGRLMPPRVTYVLARPAARRRRRSLGYSGRCPAGADDPRAALRSGQLRRPAERRHPVVRTLLLGSCGRSRAGRRHTTRRSSRSAASPGRPPST
jgi:hypothetical protein